MPSGSGPVVVIESGPSKPRVKSLVFDCPCASVTVAVKLNAPPALAAGVPETTPAELKLKPGGSDPPVRVQVYAGDAAGGSQAWA